MIADMEGPCSAVKAATSPWLPRELVDPILILTAACAKATATYTSFHATDSHAALSQAQQRYSLKVQLLAILMVIPDLPFVARLLFPLLRAHAWPPELAAQLGRLDCLEKARSLGLLADHYRRRPRDPVAVDRQTKLIQGAVYQASRNGHVYVVRWFFKHWPWAVQSDEVSAQYAVVDAPSLPDHERAVGLLAFWIEGSGVLELPDLELRAAMAKRLLGNNVYWGLEQAFSAGNMQVLAWWAAHASLTPAANVWYVDWVEAAVVAGLAAVVDLCATLSDAGTVVFANRFTKESGVRFEDMMTDIASRLGDPSILRRWKERDSSRSEPMLSPPAA